MSYFKIAPKPGFNSQLTKTANEDGWWTCNLVRWKYGLLQKIGGWQRLFNDVCAGYIRALHAWRDLSNTNNLLIGTDGGAQAFDGTNLYTLLYASDVAIALTTYETNATFSNAVIDHVFDGLSIGGKITLLMTQSIGGQVFNSGHQFTVTGLGPSYTQFNLPSPATITQTTTGSPQFNIKGSIYPSVQINLLSHGLSIGNSFTIDAVTTIIVVNDLAGNNFTLSIPAGTVITVATVPSVDSFTFDASAYFSPGSIVVPAANLTYIEGVVITPLPGSGSGVQIVKNAGDAAIAESSATPAIEGNWFLDNLGQNGLLNNSNGPIWVIPPPVSTGYLVNAGTTTAPQINTGMFVAMPQAQVISFGTEPIIGGGDLDPLLIRFSDAGSYSIWTATVSNQAGSYRLSKGSKIIGGIQAPQTTIIWTDTDIWSMTYIGPPLVYGFTIIGTGCGLIAAKARCVLGRSTYWQGQNGFWMYGDVGVQPINCPVWDTVFINLDTDNVTKCFAAANSSFNEVAFWFPTIGGTGECDSYVKYNVVEGLWDFGGRVASNVAFTRTCWTDNNIFGTPLGGDVNYRVQEHEVGYDDDGSAMANVFAETGYNRISEGANMVFADQCQPDMKWFGNDGGVSYFFKTVKYGAGPESNYGPYTVNPFTQFFSLRIRARLISMRIEWQEKLGFSARLGAPVIRISPDGTVP